MDFHSSNWSNSILIQKSSFVTSSCAVRCDKIEILTLIVISLFNNNNLGLMTFMT